MDSESWDLLHSLTSDLSYQNDGLPKSAEISYVDCSSANSFDVAPTMGDQFYPTGAESGTNIETDSPIADDNLRLPSSSYLPKNASNNTGLFLNLPSSPVIPSSNNTRLTCSSASEHFPVTQQRSEPDQNFLLCRGHLQQLGRSVPKNQSMMRANPIMKKLDGATHGQDNFRLERNQDESVFRYMIQKLLEDKEPMESKGHDVSNISEDCRQVPMDQQYISQKQQQRLLLPSKLHKLHTLPLFPQPQGRPNQENPCAYQISVTSSSSLKSGLCSRRVMQLLHNQRNRPPDNNICYWKALAAEYYANNAKKRWCFSRYCCLAGGSNGLGGYPPAAPGAWKCDICRSRSGRGFEATSLTLARLSKLNLDNGVVDELLYLDAPTEVKLRTGFIKLQYGKAVQESVYKGFRVVHEGQLHIVFNPELKIISWLFCAQHHEELLSRRLLVSQVNQLIETDQERESDKDGCKSLEVPKEVLQASFGSFMTAGVQLAKNMELALVKGIGFSKQFVRILQISEVCNSMTDLMNYSDDNHISPIETLKRYKQDGTRFSGTRSVVDNIQEQVDGGLSIDRNENMPTVQSHVNNSASGTPDCQTQSGRKWPGCTQINYYRKVLTEDLANPISNILKPVPSVAEIDSRRQMNPCRQLLPNSDSGPSTIKPGPLSFAENGSSHGPVRRVQDPPADGQNPQDPAYHRKMLEMRYGDGLKQAHTVIVDRQDAFTCNSIRNSSEKASSRKRGRPGGNAVKSARPKTSSKKFQCGLWVQGQLT